VSRSLLARLAWRFGGLSERRTRREVLRSALAAAAGAAAGCATRTPAPRSGAPHVVVVGAGLAGLAAADECLRLGLDVAVLEARKRVGGRVLTLRDLVPGGAVEAGGEFVGANHPTWLAAASRFGLALNEVAEDEGSANPIVLDGRALSDAEAKALWTAIAPALRAFSEEASAVDADAPWTSARATELDRASLADRLASLELPPLARRLLSLQLTADNGVDPPMQSWLANLAMVKGGGCERFWTDSETFHCDGGNQQLAERLADAVGRERIRLDAAAASIDDGGSRVQVRTAHGDELEADAVILAAPPSVWRRIRVSPPLPPELAPQMGLALKHLAALRGRFWKARGLGPNAVTDGMATMTWDSTGGQPTEAACLTAFSGGSVVESCRRSWRERGADGYDVAMEAIYAGYREARVATRFLDWPSDPWTAAGYSFPAPGEVTTLGPRLAAGHGRIRFAGEHTCPAFVGYMEGALRSGIEAARRVAAAQS